MSQRVNMKDNTRAAQHPGTHAAISRLKGQSTTDIRDVGITRTRGDLTKSTHGSRVAMPGGTDPRDGAAFWRVQRAKGLCSAPRAKACAP